MLSSVFVYMILSSIVFVTKTHNYISEYLLHLRSLSTEVNEYNSENWEVFNELLLMPPASAEFGTLA